MSNAVTYTADDFTRSIELSLPHGERLVEIAPFVFEERWERRLVNSLWRTNVKVEKDFLVDLPYYTLVLTNLSVRRVAFRRQRSGIFSKQQVPEITWNQAIPIESIQSTAIRTLTPHREVRSKLRAWGRPDQQATVLLVQWLGGTFECASTEEDLVLLQRQLEAMRSGLLVVRQTADLSNAIERLQQLVHDGALTESEFAGLKDQIVNCEPRAADQGLSTLRQLHQLRRSGAMGEAEYNHARWGVLVGLERAH